VVNSGLELSSTDLFVSLTRERYRSAAELPLRQLRRHSKLDEEVVQAPYDDDPTAYK
jgi:hypothetical protein